MHIASLHGLVAMHIASLHGLVAMHIASLRGLVAMHSAVERYPLQDDCVGIGSLQRLVRADDTLHWGLAFRHLAPNSNRPRHCCAPSKRFGY